MNPKVGRILFALAALAAMALTLGAGFRWH
jgi:hypothetical protein